jgi:hypothetical protein
VEVLFNLGVSTPGSTRESLQLTESPDESWFLSGVFSICFDGSFCCFTIVEHSCKPIDPESDGGICFLLFSEDISGFTLLTFVMSVNGELADLLEDIFRFTLVLNLGTFC